MLLLLLLVYNARIQIEIRKTAVLVLRSAHNLVSLHCLADDILEMHQDEQRYLSETLLGLLNLLLRDVFDAVAHVVCVNYK